MAFLGLRDVTDYISESRPEDWRTQILYLYPNGRAPLTALTSMMSMERTMDPHFHWFLQSFPEQAGTISAVWQSTSLNTNKTSSQNKDSTFAIEVAQSVQEQFRAGMTVVMTKEDDYRYNTTAEVISKGVSGGNYYLEVELTENEDATYYIGNSVSNLWVEQIGSAHEEGASMPESISYDERENDNYTQIFRTPLKITRTAQQTRYRSTGDAAQRYQEEKAQVLDRHAVEMEQALLWGEKDVDTSGAEPKRFTRGIIKAILEEGPAANVDDFKFNSSYSGDTWLQGGKEWINKRLEILFREGDPEKLALCGNGALLGLNRLAETYGDYQIDETQTDFGMSLRRWITPFGTIMLKTHPLMSRSSARRNQMAIIEPRRLRIRHVQDTIYKTDPSQDQTTNDSRDRKEEEYLTELGLEYGHLETMGFLGGVGQDNTV